MILANWLEKIKQNSNPLTFMSFLLLTNLLAFGFGRLTIQTGEPEQILVDYQPQVVMDRKVSPQKTQTDPEVQPRAPLRLNLGDNIGSVVASKNGTKYHLPTCPGAKQIKESNKISFTSPEQATLAGYTPAANCPGLK
ncbi:MAG: hypothetical protein AAB453_01420 [Patescibacteria group bacterium]